MPGWLVYRRSAAAVIFSPLSAMAMQVAKLLQSHGQSAPAREVGRAVHRAVVRLTYNH